MVGASVDGGEEDGGENEEEEGSDKPKKELNTYRIYGTLKNPDEFKPVDYVREIIKVGYKIHNNYSSILLYDVVS